LAERLDRPGVKRPHAVLVEEGAEARARAAPKLRCGGAGHRCHEDALGTVATGGFFGLLVESRALASAWGAVDHSKPLEGREGLCLGRLCLHDATPTSKAISTFARSQSSAFSLGVSVRVHQRWPPGPRVSSKRMRRSAALKALRLFTSLAIWRDVKRQRLGRWSQSAPSRRCGDFERRQPSRSSRLVPSCTF